MKIWIHRYELKPMNAKMASRQGALLKVEWAQGQVGYSDLHPWPEFGEESLEAHLRSLVEIQPTRLAEISLEFNYIDREFRLAKRNAFLGLIIPRSHKLVFRLDQLEPSLLHEWHKQGFTHLKVKMGENLKAETEQLVQLAYSTNILWRIDLNGRLTEAEAAGWWSAIDDSVKARVDFVEDPVREVQMKIAGPWANDWFKQRHARVRIVKPAREGQEETSSYDRVVFTHGLDHPFGQACAAWTAAKYYAAHPKRLEVCGLAGPEIYEPNEFSKAWFCEGPRMKPTTGTGFGFDDLLESRTWERIL